jgi:hypothetical protein
MISAGAVDRARQCAPRHEMHRHRDAPADEIAHDEAQGHALRECAAGMSAAHTAEKLLRSQRHRRRGARARSRPCPTIRPRR